MLTTRSAKLEDEFVGEGYFTLCLRIDELIQLQEKLGVGPNILAQRLLRGEWLVEDIQQTIRLGLIGGGMQHREAFDLVNRCIKEGYLIDYTALAGRLIMAALSGIEDDPIPGEAEAPTMTEATPTDD